MSLSRMKATTARWRYTPPFLAFVMTFSAMGRRALALASVVTTASAAMRDATRLPIIAFWWAASPPKRRPFLGVAGMGLGLRAQGQAALVELLEHLVEGLLAEVGDGQQVVGALLDELSYGVDLGPAEAVPGPLGQVEVLDGQVEIGRPAAQHADLAQLQGPGGIAHLGHEGHERTQGATGRRQRLTGRYRPVGLDVQAQPVVVGGLLDAGGLDVEGHPPHRREDRVHGDDPDDRRLLVALGRDVAAAPLHGDVDGQAGTSGQAGDVELGVEDLDLVVGLDVAG